MAASDQNNRRTDEAERARHIAASEAAAFATTAGTMLLGLLAGAEAAEARGEPQSPSRATPSSPRPTETVPAEATPLGREPAHGDRHASTVEPPADPVPTIHADTTTTVQAPASGATMDAPPGSPPANASNASSIPEWTLSAPAPHMPSVGPSTGVGGPTSPHAPDPAASVHQVADTSTSLVDASLALVSQTVATLGATAGQLASSLSTTVSGVVDGATSLVTNLTQPAPVADVVEPLVADILGLTPAATDSSDASPQGVSLLDTAGAVPIALLHPLPLNLGFLGQPTADGNEPHDGAFSALGVHHF
jgi:hypothetical protein